jgi:two-component system, OmpR family, response regulator VanR
MASGTIVIADDTDEVRDVVELMLQHDGYTVYSFANPHDAVAVSENIQIDLFIIDMMMPKISGLEVVEKLNVKEKPFEIIMITGKNEDEDVAEAMRLGAYGTLKKPFTYNELITFVENALASAAAKKQRVGNLMDQSENGNVGVGK